MEEKDIENDGDKHEEYFEEDDKTKVKIEKVYLEENTENVGNKSSEISRKNYEFQSNPKLHVQPVHKKIKYSCNQCDHQATNQRNLKTHIQSVHEKIKYSCNQCDYQVTRQGHLKTHIQSVHEKIKYSCNQCDHKATEKGNLKKHIQSVHEKIKYSCKLCDH